jgi:hypothetical protein
MVAGEEAAHRELDLEPDGERPGSVALPLELAEQQCLRRPVVTKEVLDVSTERNEPRSAASSAGSASAIAACSSLTHSARRPDVPRASARPARHDNRVATVSAFTGMSRSAAPHHAAAVAGAWVTTDPAASLSTIAASMSPGAAERST